MIFRDLTVRQQILAASLMRRGNVPTWAGALDTPQSEPAAQLIYERGDQYERLSLPDLCGQFLREEGLPQECNAKETVRTAVSTATAANVFSAVANASLVAGFRLAPDSSDGWTSSAEATNFKNIDRVTGQVGGLSKHPRGGDSRHVDFEAGKESYRIARYTGTFVVDEQDLIDDRMEALTRTPREMGASARELRADLVCSILLANKPLDTDSIDLFHADHNNLDTGGGSALSATSLGTGVARIAAQRVFARALNLGARYLIVPANLHVAARALLRTLDRADRDNLILRSDDRLGVAGVVDPVDGTQYAGTTTNWWLSTSMQRTIEVSTLRDTGALPQLREYLLTQGQYGIGWDVKYDIAAKSIDFRGLYQSAGV